MADAKKAKSPFTQQIFVIVGIIFSGSCWYFSNGLTGDFWYLLWLAPIPLLIISFKATAKLTFTVSFIAYLIGRLSWFSYLVTVASLVPAIIFTGILPLIFAFIVLIARRAVIKTNSWYAMFAFPVFFTTFEFLLIRFSPDGTAGSIAYSQSNFLPVIQIASVTGILGITFLVTFIPSVIAVGWHYRKRKIEVKYTLTVGASITISALLFGIVRMSTPPSKNTVKAGLIVLDEKFHNTSDHPDFKKEGFVTESYSKKITDLAAKGAGVIVLPERAINMNQLTDTDIIGTLGRAAKQNHVFIITGYTNFRGDPERNSALVINAGGSVVADYNKVHLVTGLEDQFTPGNQPGLFEFHALAAGTAICKDLDFPDYIKSYRKNDVHVLFVPAWDFVVDDWLHSRMAILRGVENGFSEVRAARLGRLTISDDRGRVKYEASASNGQTATLLGEVSLQKRDTIYARFGDWFGAANLIAAICFVFFAGRKKSNADIASAKLMIDEQILKKIKKDNL